MVRADSAKKPIKIPVGGVSSVSLMSNPNSSVEIVVMNGRCPRKGRIFSETKASIFLP